MSAPGGGYRRSPLAVQATAYPARLFRPKFPWPGLAPSALTALYLLLGTSTSAHIAAVAFATFCYIKFLLWLDQ